MKYLKSFEKINFNYNIGDYVIFHDTFNIERKEKPAIWNNHYGIIIDIVDNLYNKKSLNKSYVVRLISKLDLEMKKDIKASMDSIKSITNIDYDEDVVYISPDYLVKYDTMEEFNKAVEKIEIEKDTNKYNL